MKENFVCITLRDELVSSQSPEVIIKDAFVEVRNGLIYVVFVDGAKVDKIDEITLRRQLNIQLALSALVDAAEDDVPSPAYSIQANEWTRGDAENAEDFVDLEICLHPRVFDVEHQNELDEDEVAI